MKAHRGGFVQAHRVLVAQAIQQMFDMKFKQFGRLIGTRQGAGVLPMLHPLDFVTGGINGDRQLPFTQQLIVVVGNSLL